MLTRIALPALCALVFALPAQAQNGFAIPASAITLNYSNNNGCTLSARQVYSNGTDQLVVSLNNDHPTKWISFMVQVVLNGTGFTRTISSQQTGALGPGALVVPIRSLTPALPTSIANGSATVTIQVCSEAPNPNQRRNWR